MTNAIILHGTCSKKEYYSEKYPSLSNSHWFPWLQKQLLIKDIETSTPEIFQAYNPNYKKWKNEFEKNTINKNTILIGHSCGGGFIIRYLSENPNIKIKKVILVAPWLDPENEKQTTFFKFKINPNIINQTKKFIIFHSSNDDKDIQQSLKIIKKEIPKIQIKNFKNYGHFCLNDMKTEKFPELLNEILK